MVINEIQEKIRNIFVKLFPEVASGQFDFSRKQALFAAWDSFAHLELIANIEQEFGVTIDITEALEAESAGDFVAIVTRKLTR